MNRASKNLLARVASHQVAESASEPEKLVPNRAARRRLARMQAAVQRKLVSELKHLRPGEDREVSL